MIFFFYAALEDCMNIYTHDKDLIDGLHRNDAAAIKQLYSQHYRSLCYYAEKLIHHKAEAEDIAVNSFIKLLNKRNGFDNLPDIKAFLYTATRNACFDFLRKEKTHEASHKEIMHLSAVAEENDLDMINAEIMQAIYLEIENLPKQCGQVFKLIFFKGMHTAEIAAQMNISPKTVLNQKAKAVRMIRLALLKKGLLAVAAFFCLSAH
jgi:RNA polymerase sigma-70 factor (ECF subfamily)